jgi:hypothetical protein
VSANYKDEAFKKAVASKPDDFIQICAPSLYKILDLTAEIIPIDTHNSQIDAESNKGSRICDVCLKVKLLNGENAFVFVEKQGSNFSSIPTRLLQIYLRILDRENSFNIYPIFICVGKIIKKILPNTFNNSFLDTGCSLTYKTYTVYQADENELINDDRPFSIAILAMKYQIEAGNDPNKRGEFAIKLKQILQNKHLSDQDESIYFNLTKNYLRMSGNDISSAHREEFFMGFKQLNSFAKDDLLRIAMEQREDIGRLKGIKEGKQEGEQIGREKTLTDVAKALHGTGMPIAEIADRLNLDKDKVEKFLQAS